LDETVVNPTVPRRRLPRLPHLRLPRVRLPGMKLPGRQARRSRAEAQADSAPLIPAYRRPSLGPVAIGILLLLLGGACGYYGWLFASMAPRFMFAFAVPPALLLMFLIWALPAGDYAPTRTLGVTFWAFFAVFILWPNYLAIVLPGLPWLTLMRIVDPPLVIALLVSVSVSKPFRDQVGATLSAAPVVWKCLVAYLVVVAVTLPLSGAMGTSLNRFVILLTNQVALFFASVYIFSKPRRVEVWACLLLAMDAVLCAIGLWEDKLGAVPWANHIPSFLRIEDPLVINMLQGATRAAVGLHRVQTVQTTPLGFAELLGVSSPFALHMAINRYPLFIRALAAAMVPLTIYGIVLTDSRLGFVSLLVAATLYLLLWALLRWREVRGSIFGPAIVLSYPAIFLALVASTFLVGRLRAKVWGSGAEAASNEGRKAQWMAAIPKLIHNPIGHGYYTAGNVIGTVNASGETALDSYYITLLLDTGILGFAAYIGFFLTSAWLAAQHVIRAPGEREMRLLVPLSVSLVAFVIIKAVLNQDANHPLAFIMAGAVVALVHRSRENAPPAVSPVRRH
jgi:hypothetical protein